MQDLRLKPIALGSLPDLDIDKAIDFVYKYFPEVPFWPQLYNVAQSENMIIQFSENIPGVFLENGKLSFSKNIKDFDNKVQSLNEDFDNIDKTDIEKYQLSDNYSKSFTPFLKTLNNEIKFVKGHITGAFTLAYTINPDIFYDDNFEIFTKSITLKALWQVKTLKKYAKNAKIIMFIDEPLMFKANNFSKSDLSKIAKYINTVSKIIKDNGGIVGLHCCSNADWGFLLNLDIDILSFDAYEYSKEFASFHNEVKNFLNQDKYIAWGIVPTLNVQALEKSDIIHISEKFENSISELEKYGINRDTILNHSIITPACGMGILSQQLSEKVAILTNELSERIINKMGK